MLYIKQSVRVAEHGSADTEYLNGPNATARPLNVLQSVVAWFVAKLPDKPNGSSQEIAEAG